MDKVLSKTTKAKGQCLCGVVKFKTSSASLQLGACHCKMCRSLCSGPYLSIDCGTDVQFESTYNIGVYNSSEWAERGFCTQCGSQLFYRLKGSGQTIMSAGLFGDDLGFEFDHQVFIDEKPNYYCFSNQTENLTGAEVFAKYGASLDE